jgi:predicted GNAT family acetyltransferase
MSERAKVLMQRLEIEQDGAIAFLNYSVNDQGQLTIWHTEVPEHLRGKGIGGQLVEKALALATEKGWSVQPICSFAKAYISQHPPS